MDIAALGLLLERLKRDLADTEEEREWVLKQTGMHLPGGTPQKYEMEINRLKARVEETEDLLRAKKPAGAS
jgi:hypothetical protein